jgi:DNA-directed RNA polymerase specialized sigma24 family protein
VLGSFAEVDEALSCFQDIATLRSSCRFDGRGGGGSDPSRFSFPPALLDRLEERDELGRRIRHLPHEEQVVIARWYFAGDRPEAIARFLHRSVRHVYRVRSRAVGRLVDLGCADEFADADVSEFVA